MKSLSDRQRLMVHFEWSPGKQGRHAKIVDKLAKQSANSPSFGRKTPNVVARKQSKKQLELGSVKVTGQTLRIRIIHAQYLPPPRGGTYVVRMNDQQQNPRIDELLEKVVEDLTPYLDAIKALGQPSTARQIAEQLSLATGAAVTDDAAKRRLDQLVESGQVFPTRSKAVGRPYLYQLPGVPAEWHGDA